MDTRITATAIVDEWIKWQKFEGMFEGPLHPRTRARLESLIAERLTAAAGPSLASVSDIADTVVLTRKPSKKAAAK